jgi:TonB-linked SusC/RagA family outer membrane protein
MTRIRVASLAAALLLMAMPQLATAQARALRGTVTDARTGEPVSGAQISIRDTGIGTLTNAQGRYLITQVPEGRIEVRVLFIGYATQSAETTVAAGETVTLDFQMTVSAIELEELVATGYAQQTRAEVSSAISSVGSVDLENPAVASLDAALLGKAPGVHVIQNAGNPGNGITVRVRGLSSITANNQPLYVVDGMPIFSGNFGQLGYGGQDLSAVTGLNPDEIESVDILKDAAASSIYGSRGSNGVVMITTKRGRVTLQEGGSSAPRFQFNTSYGQQNVAKRIELMSSQQWLDYFTAAMDADGYTAAEIQDEFDWLGASNTINTDWQDEVLRTAALNNSQLSMSGGSERFQYLASGSYFDQEGIILGSAYARASGRVNLDFQASDKLNITTSLALSQEVNDRIESDNSIESAVTNAIANEPWTPVYEDDGSFSGRASYANPVGIALMNDVEARTLRAFGNATVAYSATSWLRATGRVGFDFLSLREFEYNSSEVPLTYASGVNGVSRIANAAGRRYLTEGFLTGDYYVGAHDFILTAGSSLETNDRESSFIRGEGFTSPDLHWPANAARAAGYDGTAWEANLISYFGRLNYSYDDRFVINGSIRRDGSSRFGSDSKYGVFPSASVAWVLSNESFMEDMELFSDLKIRGSWGETGNEAIGDFQYLGLYGTANYGEVPGTAPSNLSNPGLKWETTQEWNIGVDAGLLSDRVGVTFDVYNKATEDLLLSRPVTRTSGFSSVLANVGGIENRGWEASLSTVNFQSASPTGFNWTTTFTVTHNVNEVTKLYSPNPNEPGEPFNVYFYNRVEEGQPIGAFYTYEFVDVDDATGDALYTDLDDDGNVIGTTDRPSSNDRMIVGSPHPDYFGGLRNSMRGFGFDVTAFFEFSFGAEIMNAMREYADDGGYFYDNKFADVGVDYWTPDNPTASKPRPSYWGTSGARYDSSRWMEDASYIRLGEVTVGYTFPSNIAAKMGASTARLYVAGKNVMTWSDYSGYAPDLNSAGSSASSASLGTDFYAYPLARTFTIGFQGTW